MLSLVRAIHRSVTSTSFELLKVGTTNDRLPAAVDKRNLQTSSAGEQPQYTSVKLEKASEHVAHITLSRPKKRNAINYNTCDELCAVLRELEDNKDWRCAILSGEGQDFTSGLDLMATMDQFGKISQIEDIGRRAKEIKLMVEKYQTPIKAMDKISKPIIGVLHGNCIGMGMELAASCDIRYCSSDVNFEVREVKIGIAADVGSLQKLPLLISNQSYLRELIYTGRAMPADDAFRFGFASKICATKESTFEAALSLAQELAKLSPVAVQGSKVNLRFSTNQSLDVGLEYNAVWNMAMMQSQDVPRAITSIVTKSDATKYDPY